MREVRLIHGDCVEQMRAIPEASVDAIVTDPPYGLEFMGKDWDKLTRNQMLAEEGTRERERINEYGNSYAGRRSKLPDLGAQGRYAAESQAWHEAWAREALRVLKPGGHLLAFGGTRTYHRMACAIEDAGFEIRDSIHWVYGSGFPKSLDVSKAIDKRRDDREDVLRVTGEIARLRDASGLTNRDLDGLFGFAGMAGHWTSIKSQPAVPTIEQWTVLRERLEPPQWLDDEVWRLNGRKGKPGEAWAEREVVGTRAGSEMVYAPGEGRKAERKNVLLTAPATDEARKWEGWGTALKPAHEPIVVARKPLQGTVAGNVLAFGTGGLNIDGCRVPPAGDGYYAHEGFVGEPTPSNAYGSYRNNMMPEPHAAGRWPANVVFDTAAAEALDEQSGGEGGASRFFTRADFSLDDWPFVYQAKPSRKERNAGLKGLPEKAAGNFDDDGHRKPGERKNNHTAPMPRANHHPTVKPVALMRHLVRLVTPPGGTVLDPFAGSGTTLVAAILEGFDCIGVEMTDEYLPIIEGRVAWAEQQAASEPPRLL